MHPALQDLIILIESEITMRVWKAWRASGVSLTLQACSRWNADAVGQLKFNWWPTRLAWHQTRPDSAAKLFTSRMSSFEKKFRGVRVIPEGTHVPFSALAGLFNLLYLPPDAPSSFSFFGTYSILWDNCSHFHLGGLELWSFLIFALRSTFGHRTDL